MPNHSVIAYFHSDMINHYEYVADLALNAGDTKNIEYLYFHKTEDIWGSMGLWYFTEINSGVHRIELSNQSDHSVNPNITPPTVSILICDIEKKDVCTGFINKHRINSAIQLEQKEQNEVKAVFFQIPSNKFPGGSGWMPAWHYQQAVEKGEL